MLVDADISSSLNLHGKYVGDLQDGIEIDRLSISGNLRYLTDYTGFSDEVSEQGGNYLALRFSVPGIDDATITVTLVGGEQEPVAVGTGGIFIFRITSTDQTIAVRVSAPYRRAANRTYDLRNITLEHVSECGTLECGEQ